MVTPTATQPALRSVSTRQYLVDGILWLAWSWLVVAAMVSWTLHPLVATPLDPSSWFELLRGEVAQTHVVYLLGLGAFAWIARQRSTPRGPFSLLWILCGLGFVIAYRRYGSNELAGVLLFFLPWSVAMAFADPENPEDDEDVVVPTRAGLLDPTTPSGRAVALLAALLFAGMLYTTGSRSGLGAAAFTVVALLVVLGKRGRHVLLASGLGGLVWLLSGGWGRLLEFFVFDGKAQQLSFYTFLTGRPHIWNRHAQAVADMPFTGVGLGASEQTIREFYPLTRFEPIMIIEDAHNAWLHVATELGLPALVALLLLWIVAATRLVSAWRVATDRMAAKNAQRVWLLGIGGGLVAYSVYGLVDVVAFGQVGSLPLWCLLGLACQKSATGSTETGKLWRYGIIKTIFAAGLTLALLSTAVFLPRLEPAKRLSFNLATLKTMRAVLTAPEQRGDALTVMQSEAEDHCHGHYFVARLASAMAQPRLRDQAFGALFDCGEDFDDLVAFLQPDHRTLAVAAYLQHPQSAAAQLWRGRQLAKGTVGQRLQARPLFRAALALDPNNSRAWVEMGNLHYQEDKREALIAYAEACARGDYYGQGCSTAGATALELGEIEAAIRFYRSSRVPGSRAFAQGLEAQWKRRQTSEPDTVPVEP